MEELIKIKPHPGGDGFTIPLKNGNIDIPDSPGGYCIFSVCEREYRKVIILRSG